MNDDRNEVFRLLDESFHGDLIKSYIIGLENQIKEEQAKNEHLEKCLDIALKEISDENEDKHIFDCKHCSLLHEYCDDVKCYTHNREMLENYLKEQENGQ